MKNTFIKAVFIAIVFCQNCFASDVSFGQVITGYDGDANCDLFQSAQKSVFRIASDQCCVVVSFSSDVCDEMKFVTNRIPENAPNLIRQWATAFGPQFARTEAYEKASAIKSKLMQSKGVYPPELYRPHEVEALQMLLDADYAFAKEVRSFFDAELKAVMTPGYERELRFVCESQRTKPRDFKITIHNIAEYGVAHASKQNLSEEKGPVGVKGSDEDEDTDAEGDSLTKFFTIKPADERFAYAKHMNQFTDLEEFLEFVMDLLERTLAMWVSKAKMENANKVGHHHGGLYQ